MARALPWLMFSAPQPETTKNNNEQNPPKGRSSESGCTAIPLGSVPHWCLSAASTTPLCWMSVPRVAATFPLLCHGPFSSAQLDGAQLHSCRLGYPQLDCWQPPRLRCCSTHVDLCFVIFPSAPCPVAKLHRKLERGPVERQRDLGPQGLIPTVPQLERESETKMAPTSVG